MAIKYIPEPFRIKVVEPLRMLTRKEREVKIAEAKYNLFGLRSEDVYIDLLTDSGTNAMSQFQWAGIMQGDEAYAGATSYFKLLDAGKDIFKYDYIQPVHQGRAAEKVLLPLFLSEGKFAISNMFFDTTRAHVILSGARPIDCVVEIALDPAKRAPFKGNMDVEKLEKLIKEHGKEKIGLVVMTITNNSAGGQPVSMQNIKETSEVCKKYGITFNIDAARYAENAFFIQRDEKGYKDKSIKEIIRETFSYADMFTMSAKKRHHCKHGRLNRRKGRGKIQGSYPRDKIPLYGVRGALYLRRPCGAGS
jgi:tryptophanase